MRFILISTEKFIAIRNNRTAIRNKIGIIISLIINDNTNTYVKRYCIEFVDFSTGHGHRLLSSRHHQIVE